MKILLGKTSKSSQKIGWNPLATNRWNFRLGHNLSTVNSTPFQYFLAKRCTPQNGFFMKSQKKPWYTCLKWPYTARPAFFELETVSPKSMFFSDFLGLCDLPSGESLYGIWKAVFPCKIVSEINGKKAEMNSLSLFNECLPWLFLRFHENAFLRGKSVG